MTAPMLPRSINNQFRKAMKRRRGRMLTREIHAARKLKQQARSVDLPETPESIADFYARWYRRFEP